MQTQTTEPLRNGGQGVTRNLKSAFLVGAFAGTFWTAHVLVERTHAPQPPCHYYVGVDVSGSFRSHLTPSLQFVATLAKGLGPDDRLTIYTISDQATERFDSKGPQSAAQMVPTLRSIQNKPATGRGTDPSCFWVKSLARIRKEAMAARIVYLSDADNDAGPPSHIRIRQEVGAAADCGNLKSVAVIGVETGNFEPMRQDLGAFSQRLHLYNAQQIDNDTLDQVAPE